MKRKDYISWNNYFMAIAQISAMRSKDPNTQVGACIVGEDNRIVSVGYNGFPIGCDDDELPWGREGSFLDTKYAYVIHAENSAIALSSLPNLKGCKLYSTLYPCNECAKVIIQKGIKEVYYLNDIYCDKDFCKAARILFHKAGVKTEQLKPSNREITIKLYEL